MDEKKNIIIKAIEIIREMDFKDLDIKEKEEISAMIVSLTKSIEIMINKNKL